MTKEEFKELEKETLYINNFEVVHKTDNFNPDVLDLVEAWLRELE